MSRRASSVGGLRNSHVAPPSEVERSAPLLPAAQPFCSFTKKTVCSHANVPVPRPPRSGPAPTPAGAPQKKKKEGRGRKGKGKSPAHAPRDPSPLRLSPSAL